MTIERRALLQGLTGAAMLVPFAAPQSAPAQTASAQPPAPHGPPNHMAKMQQVFGAGMMGSERIAMLLYPGLTALDLVGPHYYLACMMGAKVDLITAQADLSPVTSDLGLAILPTVTLAKARPDYDILFIPGGTAGTMAVMRDKITIAWVKACAAKAKYITSVCTGSMILGKAGLLKGRRATSHWAAHDALSDFGAIPVQARVVTDGNVITGAGVSAGMDLGIAIVAALRGQAYAQGLMLQSEYAPEPPFAGGTLASTPADIRDVMTDYFARLKVDFRALAKS
jgi:cyclohexyl-isocyanide hydratase